MKPHHCTDPAAAKAAGASRTTLWRMKKRGWAVPDYHHRKEETPSWADRDILILHEGVLVRSLHALKLDERTADSTIQDIWEWIMEDSDRMFSFMKCCGLFGLDPDELRISLVCLAKRGVIAGAPK